MAASRMVRGLPNGRVNSLTLKVKATPTNIKPATITNTHDQGIMSDKIGAIAPGTKPAIR